MKTFSITDIGKKRSMNQDYVYSMEQPIGNLPNLFIVADGMGGHNAGDYASRCTVETIEQFVKETNLKEPAAIMEAAIQKANAAVIAESNAHTELRGMGTTVVMASIYANHKMVVANVGDSRLYVVDEEMKQITKDHSLVEEMVRMGEMDKAKAKNHPKKNYITRAVGASDEIEADFFEVELEPSDMVLMCTDGLTNMVEDMDIRNIMKGQRDVAEAAERLVETANDRGGRDNVTVIVIEPFADEVKVC
ncbi:MAG: Stp1/IreP family PP2C-type Ser/Thr phosphatase [Lachnospiraceae bacterium]|nr:Stp1/IreP family PP2C-type Ser/Thr phosphatase [Lachnospiraceae bacterium]